MVSQAGLHMSSADAGVLGVSEQLRQGFLALRADRHSSRVELGSGLGEIYVSLSEKLAASNSLHKGLRMVSRKRAEAMRVELPEGSLIREPLLLFLRLTVDVDDDLLRLILSTGQMASLALRQQRRTESTLRSIQNDQYCGAR